MAFRGEGHRLDGQPVWRCPNLPSMPVLTAQDKEKIHRYGIVLTVISLIALLMINSLASNGVFTPTVYSSIALGFTALALIGATAFTLTSTAGQETRKKVGIAFIVMLLALTTLFALSAAHVISHNIPMITLWTAQGAIGLMMTAYFCMTMIEKLSNQA